MASLSPLCHHFVSSAAAGGQAIILTPPTISPPDQAFHSPTLPAPLPPLNAICPASYSWEVFFYSGIFKVLMDSLKWKYVHGHGTEVQWSWSISISGWSVAVTGLTSWTFKIWHRRLHIAPEFCFWISLRKNLVSLETRALGKCLETWQKKVTILI